MKTHSLLGTFTAILGSLSLLTIVELKAPSYAFAQNIVPLCSPTYDLNVPQGFCVFPAETYGTTIYQIAICKNNPLQSPMPDTSSCFFLYNNSSGQYVDLANYLNSGFTLNTLDKEGRPPNGDYDYVYGLFSNIVKIKGSVTIQQGTYYTTNTPDPNLHEGSLASTSISSHSTFDSPIWSETVDNGNYGCFGSDGVSYLDSNGQPTIFNSPFCTGATRIAMAVTTQSVLGSTIRITEDVRGIDMKFGASRGLGIYYSGFPDKAIDFQGFDFTLEVLR